MARAGRKSDKNIYATAQLLNYARDSYLERTSRPIYAIVFLLPFILFYELGTILINTNILNQYQVRVVAFVWLQSLLRHLGTGSRLAWIAPPLVVVIILIGLQIASRKPWYFCPSDYMPMLFECVFLAVPLIVLSLMFNSPTVTSDNLSQLDGGPGFRAERSVACGTWAGGGLPSPGATAKLVWLCSSDGVDRSRFTAKRVWPWHLSSFGPGPLSAARPGGHSLMTDIVTGVGAGIYEELVFRLILICALMVLFQDLIGLGHQNAVVLSILISAALFSAHHHIVWVDGRLGRSAPFLWTEFGFRTLAGVYFAILFAVRGFGITAGTHAFYDIIATIVNATFFDA